jgi:hypothetical protein
MLSFQGMRPRAVRAAAEHAEAVKAQRDALVAEWAACGSALEALKHRLNAELAGKSADTPEGVKAAQTLDAYETGTRLLEKRIPAADEAVVAAWYSLSAALRAAGGEWNTYICIPEPQELLRRLSRPYRLFLAAGAEVQRIEGHLHRHGITRQATPESYGREARRQKLEAILNDLAAMPAAYREALTPPPPPAPEPEPVPESDTDTFLRISQGARGDRRDSFRRSEASLQILASD